MRTIISLLILANFTSAMAADIVMEKCGSAMDIAETNLRILLSRPAQGKIPKEWKTENEIIEASKKLLRVELRYPGCLRGDFGSSTWKQYNEVRKMFDELMGTGDMVRSTIVTQESAETQKKLRDCQSQLALIQEKEPKVYSRLFRDFKKVDETIRKRVCDDTAGLAVPGEDNCNSSGAVRK